MSELDRLYELMDDGFKGVHARLDQLNGRTRENEKAIAVLQDRGVRSKDTTARVIGGGAAMAGFMVEILKRMFGGG